MEALLPGWSFNAPESASQDTDWPQRCCQRGLEARARRVGTAPLHTAKGLRPHTPHKSTKIMVSASLDLPASPPRLRIDPHKRTLPLTPMETAPPKSRGGRRSREATATQRKGRGRVREEVDAFMRARKPEGEDAAAPWATTRAASPPRSPSPARSERTGSRRGTAS